jgi:magnesium chelatase subunit H
MMQKHISAADIEGRGAAPVRVVIVTLDSHLASVARQAEQALRKDIPGLEIKLHAAADWANEPETLEACKADIATADVIIATLIFLEDQVTAILPALQARREDCDCMVGCMAEGEIVKLTKLGKFDMDGEQTGPVAMLKKLRGSAKKGDAKGATAGARQMAMLRRLPKILRFIPGTAQDVRAYFLTMQYWLAGSEDNVANMIRFLLDRYATGPREALRGSLKPKLPVVYPDVGLYHPTLEDRVTEDITALPHDPKARGTVGLLVMRSYVLAGNTAHYDGVIDALESRGLNVVPAFSAGLDGRPAADAFFRADDGNSRIDALVSLTGFSLVGGPAYNDSAAAEDLLADLDIPYIAAHAMEFQTLESWGNSNRGLMPVENTIMVAIPELDGATSPTVFGGRSDCAGEVCAGCTRGCRFEATQSTGDRDMRACIERCEMLADRVTRLVDLRISEKANRKLAIVLFNFPPNAGNTGTAAFLSVFQSLHNTLKSLKAEGYDVEVPESVDALRDAIIHGNAAENGAYANVHDRITADDHVRKEPWLKDIEAQWGTAPGRQLSDGATIYVLGKQFGNVFVGIQPGFGYEGDPMRLLFESDAAPTHAFSAFYRYLRDDFGAHAVLHFGTHGALEFMPGKQTGMSEACWPDRLIGNLPNFYLYAANNPSEGAIAKRRSAATLITYLTPPLATAGLYKGLVEIKASIERWRSLAPDEIADRQTLAEIIQAQAAELDLAIAEPAWTEMGQVDVEIHRLSNDLIELEHALIPHGLHVAGGVPTREERTDMLRAMAEANQGLDLPRTIVSELVDGLPIDELAAALAASALEGDVEAATALLTDLRQTDELLARDHELPALMHALDGGYIRPVAGGDLVRTPQILPTGRNLHGFDPFRIPSALALEQGKAQAKLLIDRTLQDGNSIPETVAIVLWGTDNLKSEGGPIGQALALMGTKPRFDSYGRLCGAELIPLEELGRPRIDVMMTLSGIFRDLLPLQTKLLAEAAFLAASADEPDEQNFVAKHARAHAATHGCSIEEASFRVFSNADGAYGSNVNDLVQSGAWNDENELGDSYTRRKCFAYGRDGQPMRQGELMQSLLSTVELTYQNLESVELGVTTIDHYFDTLGGITRAVERARGDAVPVYIGDQTRGGDKVRSLTEQVALETRTRALNPKWYEGMLSHGYEGVRQIEAHVTNTMGWSATTGQVDPWVYQQLTQTFILDPEMRERMAALNPAASSQMANRLIEAQERQYWDPDEAILEALRQAGEELEDRLEGITSGGDSTSNTTDSQANPATQRASAEANA